ncbi:MAG: SDR family NAD(P)-dependent oxidoreductase [Clostridium sp.]
MESIYRYIIENIANNKIEKQTAYKLITMLKNEEKNNDIAIIGMAGKFPMADSIGEFWENISQKIDMVTQLPEERKADIFNYLSYLGKDEDDIKFGEASYFKSIDKFDYKFFNISPKEASLIDPSHRFFLETSWHAIEDAGYSGERIKESNTGVFVGYYSNIRDSYQRIINDIEPKSISVSMSGNLSAMLPSRISYLLDLKGPSMVIDTACSSSLVAINVACKSILEGECDMALAGGVKINTMAVENANEKLGIESSDSKTRTFDEGSDGAGTGEGVAVVLLKRLKDAIRDKDNIHAVIKGSAINQDGSSISLTAPNPLAQTNVIEVAWKNAQINPETIDYIEVHGTGTNLGDPIEIQGIEGAFRKYTNKKQCCALSSVKSNMGHSFEAAGSINLIKAVMALKEKKIPPMINFNRPNKEILFKDSTVYVNTRLREWKKKDTPRRCGVSAFGFSGTNCHVVLEEAPEIEISNYNKELFIFTLSAKGLEELAELIKEYIKFLTNTKTHNLMEICYTANTGRDQYPYRVAIIIKSIDELVKKLEYIEKNGFENLDDANIYYGYFNVINIDKDLLSKYTKEKNDITHDEKISLDLCAKKYVEDNKKNIISGNLEMYESLCKLYINGATIKWDSIYEEKINKVSLPVYPFKKTRCWIDIPRIKKLSKGNMYYGTKWIEQKIESSQIGNDSNTLKTILVLRDIESSNIYEGIINELINRGHEVIVTEIATSYKEIDNNNLLISNTEEDFLKLANIIKDRRVSLILDMLSVTNNNLYDNVNELEYREIYSIYYFTKALVLSGLHNNIDMVSIGKNVFRVLEKDEVHPFTASKFGFERVIEQENTNITVRCLDVDDSLDYSKYIFDILNNQKSFQIAFRNSNRYVQMFDSISISDKDSIELKEEGVYLITGGTGGMGIEISKMFAKKKNINVALISRSKLPSHEEWDSIIKENKDLKLCNKLKGIQKIMGLGSNVELLSGDVSDYDFMKKTIEFLVDKYGKINGVIHAAGIVNAGLLIRKKQSEIKEVMDTKIKGTIILDKLTENQNLDFFVLFSSGLTLIGEPGMCDYVAANAFLDSYSDYRNAKGKKTTTINWVSWKETGMSVDYGINVDKIFKTITTEKALNGFENAILSDKPQVLIGEINYDDRYTHLIENARIVLSNEIRKNIIAENVLLESSNVKNDNNILLKGKENSNYSEIEKKLAKIFKNTLGISEVNIYDNFFELGGDSILLSKMYSLIDNEFPNCVKITELFEYTSIYKLAKFIEEKIDGTDKKGNDSEYEILNQMFDDLQEGKISIDDALKLL